MHQLMSRFPLFIVFFFFCLTHAAIDYDQEYNDIEFVPEHSNEWVVRIDEGRVQKEKNFDWRKGKKHIVSMDLGDEVADLVASELGLQNRRKVIDDERIIR